MKMLDWLGASKGPWVSWAIVAAVLFMVAGCGSQAAMQESSQATPQSVVTSATSATDSSSEEEHTEEEHEHETEEEHTEEEHEHETEEEHTEEEHEHETEEELDLSGIIPIPKGDILHVVATTNIVGNVVDAIGGDAIDLKVLMPLGTDPHSFEPTPQDMSAVTDADIVFINGVGLEEFLQPMLDSTGASEGKVIPVSHGIEFLTFAAKPQHEHAEDDHEHAEDDHEHAEDDHDEHAEDDHDEHAEDDHDEHTEDDHDEHAEDDHDEHAEDDHEHEHAHDGADPHVWFSPMSIEVWVHTIEHTLSYADPANADTYAANAAAYTEELQELDAWIMEQVEQVPEANRKLVTDHTAFGYFAHRYGFEQVGAVIPGYSTMAEPSAKELAALEDAILAHNVPALFVGNTVNPNLSERIAQDTGTEMVMLYTGSLSEAGGPADTYVRLMRYNTQAIVDALK